MSQPKTCLLTRVGARLLFLDAGGARERPFRGGRLHVPLSRLVPASRCLGRNRGGLSVAVGPTRPGFCLSCTGVTPLILLKTHGMEASIFVCAEGTTPDIFRLIYLSPPLPRL